MLSNKNISFDLHHLIIELSGVHYPVNKHSRNYLNMKLPYFNDSIIYDCMMGYHWITTNKPTYLSSQQWVSKCPYLLHIMLLCPYSASFITTFCLLI